MSIRSAALAAVFAAAVAAPLYAASAYVDPDGRFAVGVPDEWIAGKPTDAASKVAALLAKRTETETFAVCVVAVTETPVTKSMTQAEINKESAVKLGDDFWLASYKAQGAQDVVISSSAVRDAHSGRKVQTVSAEFSIAQTAGGTMRFKSREELHMQPGRVHDVGCLSPVAKFDGVKNDIEAILLSYDPQGGLTVQGPAVEPSVVTLYARANFEGVARVVKHQVVNVGGRTGSITVSGAGAWQVCEGASFTGPCTIVASAKSASGHGVLNVGSLRPVAATPAQGVESAAATNRATLLNEALRQFGSK
jgi:hypothetical protein